MAPAMTMRTRFPLTIRLGAAGVLAASGLTLAAAIHPQARPSGPAIEAVTVSPAAARALGAHWRETRRPETARQYAEALLAAGLNNELVAAIVKEGLFADDQVARTLFRAEALLRLNRFSEAAALADAPLLEGDPYAAFIRVRSNVGLGGGLDLSDLALATRGPADLAREAWLLRARVALDDNDFAAADASLRRASEAGATAARLEPFRIERDIRAGSLAKAAAGLDARARSLARAAARRGEVLLDVEGWRLAAMLALRAGDAREAARLADRAMLGAPGTPGAAFAAFAKWSAGDVAQARAILAAHLRAVPDDWRARDLAAAVAFAWGDAHEGEEQLAALAHLRPRLAAFRRLMRAAAARDFDAAYAAATDLAGDGPLSGAASSFVGAGAAFPAFPEPLEADAALAAVLAAADLRRARAAVSRLTDLRRAPVDLVAAAATLARQGDLPAAAALAEEAGSAAPDFYAALALRASLLEGEGRADEALRLHDQFLAAHPARADAALGRALLLARTGSASAAAAAFAALDPAVAFSTEESALAYARAATQAGDRARALMLADASKSLPPDRLAAVRETAQDDAGAAAAWRQALIALPSADGLAERYRAAMARQGRLDDAEAFLRAVARRAAPDPTLRGGDTENADL